MLKRLDDQWTSPHMGRVHHWEGRILILIAGIPDVNVQHLAFFGLSVRAGCDSKDGVR